MTNSLSVISSSHTELRNGVQREEFGPVQCVSVSHAGCRISGGHAMSGTTEVSGSSATAAVDSLPDVSSDADSELTNLVGDIQSAATQDAAATAKSEVA